MNSWIVLCVQTFVRPCQRRSAGLRLRRSPEADGSSEVLKLRRMTFLRKMFWRSSWKYLFRSILLKIHDHEAPRSTRPWDDCLFHLHPNPLLERHSLLFVCCACVCAMSVCVCCTLTLSQRTQSNARHACRRQEPPPSPRHQWHCCVRCIILHMYASYGHTSI